MSSTATTHSESFMSPAISTAPPPSTGLTHWEFDPTHTSAHFGVRHMMVSTVRGEFAKVTGSVDIPAEDVEGSSLRVIIDATSINTREPKRDEHLRSADFLDVEHYPTIQFHSTRITRDNDGSLKIVGNLTIRGVTKEVVLAVEDGVTELKDPFGNIRRGASATTKINRKDFGLLWNMALETGGLVVGDEVKIQIDVELVKK